MGENVDRHLQHAGVISSQLQEQLWMFQLGLVRTWVTNLIRDQEKPGQCQCMKREICQEASGIQAILYERPKFEIELREKSLIIIAGTMMMIGRGTAKSIVKEKTTRAGNPLLPQLALQLLVLSALVRLLRTGEASGMTEMNHPGHEMIVMRSHVGDAEQKKKVIPEKVVENLLHVSGTFIPPGMGSTNGGSPRTDTTLCPPNLHHVRNAVPHLFLMTAEPVMKL